MSEAGVPEQYLDPNARDYIVLHLDRDDPTRFVWMVFAGNHFQTHRSRGSYSRKSSAKKAARREHPHIERIVDRTRPDRGYPSIPR